MHKGLIINFIKDRINVIGLFLFNSIILILFFNMENGTRKEVFYPLVLSGFSLMVLITTEWFKYYRFNYSLQKVQNNINQDLSPVTTEQKEINRIRALAAKRHTAEITQILAQNKNKSYFLSQWIHNLKTPISVIDLISQKCVLENKDPYEALDQIKHENKRLHNSIEQVLTIIRLDDFEKDYEAVPINLVENIKKLLHDRKRQFILSDVFPELICEAEEMHILSDRKWNELMLEQVISNAIKYSKEEGKTKKIYIDISRRGDHTILSIRDEGIGIPSYDIDRVFEPFFTGENGRRYRDSTGIGLHISSEIAKKLGHEISIKSELQRGTEVSFKYITKL